MQSKALMAVLACLICGVAAVAQERPSILVIWGDDIGWFNLSSYNSGMMGYRTPNLDRIAKEGIRFTDYYGDQSCTAGRSTFITGQSGLRTGMTKVGLPGSDLGLLRRDITIAEYLKTKGYATGQFGKNHLGDRDEHLPTNHGFDEFLGNLYHLNAENRAKTMALWAEPFVTLRLPKIHNLRRNPFGRAEHNSNTYYDWMIDKVPYVYLGLATTAQFLQTFKEYPPSQRADSWSVDKLTNSMLEKLK